MNAQKLYEGGMSALLSALPELIPVVDFADVVRPADAAYRLPKRFRRLSVPILFDEQVLRTGDSLCRVGWNGKTFHILPQKYAPFKSLRSSSLSIDELILRSEYTSPEEKQAVRDDWAVSAKKRLRAVDALLSERDEFADHQRTHHPDVLSDREWISPTAEPFVPAEWTKVEHIGMPETPAAAPAPFIGAVDYRYFVGIPILNKKTAAKKESNLQRKRAERDRLCAERKVLFKQWGKQLREILGSHVNSHVGARYEAENCPRCGASVFTTPRRVCFDCGYTLGELHYKPRTQDLTSYRDGLNMPPVQEITRSTNRRRRRRLTPEQFVAGLILRGQFENLTDTASLEKAAGTYQILCEGWLPRDVAESSGVAERTIASRAERLFETVTRYQVTGLPLPQPNTNELSNLKQCLGQLRIEIPYLRRGLCTN
jgi:ribosomal protein L37E